MPAKLAKTSRVPSWQAVALCILKNDLEFRGLGFGREDSALVEQIYSKARKEKSGQIDLI